MSLSDRDSLGYRLDDPYMVEDTRLMELVVRRSLTAVRNLIHTCVIWSRVLMPDQIR